MSSSFIVLQKYSKHWEGSLMANNCGGELKKMNGFTFTKWPQHQQQDLLACSPPEHLSAGSPGLPWKAWAPDNCTVSSLQTLYVHRNLIPVYCKWESLLHLFAQALALRSTCMPETRRKPHALFPQSCVTHIGTHSHCIINMVFFKQLSVCLIFNFFDSKAAQPNICYPITK